MILVTGGAYQGKSRFIQKNYPEAASGAADGRTAAFEDLLTAGCIFSFEEWVRREIKVRELSGNKTEAYLAEKIRQLIQENPGTVIELAEVGCGLVPLDAGERAWRESTGRAGCLLAEKSEEVYRLVMGIPMRIK